MKDPVVDDLDRCRILLPNADAAADIEAEAEVVAEAEADRERDLERDRDLDRSLGFIVVTLSSTSCRRPELKPPLPDFPITMSNYTLLLSYSPSILKLHSIGQVCRFVSPFTIYMSSTSLNLQTQFFVIEEVGTRPIDKVDDSNVDS